MKATFHRLSLTLITLVLGTSAQAVPIHFNFTGTVNYEQGTDAVGLLNQSVSGGFTFETDALVMQPRDDDAWIETHYDIGPTRSTSHLTIGDREFTLPVMRDRGNDISFFDGCRPAPMACTHDAGESFMLFAYSTDLPYDTTSVTGIFNVAQLMFSSSAREFQRSTTSTCSRAWNPDRSSTCPCSICRSATTVSVPEPGTLGLLGAGIAAAFVLRRRRSMP